MEQTKSFTVIFLYCSTLTASVLVQSNSTRSTPCEVPQLDQATNFNEILSDGYLLEVFQQSDTVDNKGKTKHLRENCDIQTGDLLQVLRENDGAAMMQALSQLHSISGIDEGHCIAGLPKRCSVPETAAGCKVFTTSCIKTETLDTFRHRDYLSSSARHFCDYVPVRKGGKLNLEECAAVAGLEDMWRLAKQAMDAVKCLHDKGYVHTKTFLNNFMLNDCRDPKINGLRLRELSGVREIRSWTGWQTQWHDYAKLFGFDEESNIHSWQTFWKRTDFEQTSLLVTAMKKAFSTCNKANQADCSVEYRNAKFQINELKRKYLDNKRSAGRRT